MWTYTPISVRFVDNGEVYANSGVNITYTGKPTQQYNLTVNVLPDVILSRCDVYITSDKHIDPQKKQVDWYKAEKLLSMGIADVNPQLREFLLYFMTHGFDIIPLSQKSTNLNDFKLLNLTTNKSFSGDPITFGSPTKGLPIDVMSFPFSLSNPVFFSNMISSGHINYLTDFGYLCDVKYIDNMVGGVVVHGTCSFGLVMCNLRKFNGDGDLVFILSWDVVFNMMQKIGTNKLMATVIQPDIDTRLHGVLPVQVTYKHSQTWGSCVVFSPEILLTNYHVIKQYSSIHIFLNDTVMEVDEEKIIPFKDADLAFIKLSFKNQFKLQNSHVKPVNYTLDYDINDQVNTVGYGLFFNEKFLQPIDSRGKIIMKKQIPLRVNDGVSIPGVVLTSAPCWNGSSGGGLFKDGQFIGVICSNAQIKTFNSTLQKYETEKLSQLCFILPIEVILQCYESLESGSGIQISHQFKQLWNLLDNHRDNYKL